jgi:hypothetical protein
MILNQRFIGLMVIVLFFQFNKRIYLHDTPTAHLNQSSFDSDDSLPIFYLQHFSIKWGSQKIQLTTFGC